MISKKIFTLLKICLGILLKILSKIFVIDRSVWVFGSGKGELYNENSKYFYNYVLDNCPEIRPIWISKERDIVKLIRKNGGSAYFNYGFRGLYYVFRAKYYFFSTIRSDIEFFFPKKSKIVVNLYHGMPIKKVIYDYKGNDLKKNTFITKLYNYFVAGFMWNKISLNISTSEYFSQILKSAFRTEKIKETGLPRNDIFFSEQDKNSIKKRLEIPLDKFVISYLPTHRAFGNGQPIPFPFLNNTVAHEFFEKNECVFINKAHYNMPTNESKLKSKSLINISKKNIDTQELLYVTDILITDYSSCFVDFLLLNRPILFYFFDSYQKEDTELYFNIEEQQNAPGKIHTSEIEMLKSLDFIIQGNDEFKQIRNKFLKKYHTFCDGNSSKRIVKLCKDNVGSLC